MTTFLHLATGGANGNEEGPGASARDGLFGLGGEAFSDHMLPLGQPSPMLTQQ